MGTIWWLLAASNLLLVACTSKVEGYQQPILYLNREQAPLQSVHSEHEQPQRIAIVGAGAGGSSAAYYLSQFAKTSNYNIPLDITVFDINSRAGGRTTTVNALDNPKYPVEVGASIFVKVNHILYNASRDFGLSTDKLKRPSTGSFFEMGVWDGKDFVFTTGSEPDRPDGIKDRLGGWWDIAKLLWKYGLSPIRTNQLMKSTVGKFLNLYDENFPFSDLNEVTAEIGLDDFTGVTGKDALSRASISEEFSRHVVQASTRVNYAQNLENIHGLETMVCMATDGAMAVQGGNWQIFDEFIKRSNAKSRYDTAVTSIKRTEKNSFRITSKSTSPSSSDPYREDEFDTIILAAPYQFANISFQPELTATPAEIDYVTLHVTLFTSPLLPSAPFFGLDGQWEVPDTILTTLPPDYNISGTHRGADAVGPTEFWSISTRALDPDDGDSSPSEQQYLYKIFSPQPISIKFLARMFNYAIDGIETDSDDFVPLSRAPSSLVSWYHLKTWQSYPYLPPTTAFPAIKLDPDVWYTSGIEPFISTMETSALSGRNVARLIVDELERRMSAARGMEGDDIVGDEQATVSSSDSTFMHKF